MIFNGTDFTQFPWMKIEKVYPPETTGLKNRWLTPVEAEARFAGETIEPYTRKVDIRLIEKTKEKNFKNRAKLLSLLRTDSVSKLQFDGEFTYERAKLESATSNDYMLGTLKIEVIFMCPFGKAFSEKKSIEITSNTEVLSWGFVKTFPKFTITGYTGDILINHQTSGKFISIDTTGKTLPITVDCWDMTVMTGTDSLRSKVSFTSDYFSLLPGENVLSYSGGGTCVMEWNDCW